MRQGNKQKIKIFSIGDSFVEFALNAPEEYLKSGKGHSVIKTVAAKFSNIHKDIKQVIVWTLSGDQKKNLPANIY